MPAPQKRSFSHRDLIVWQRAQAFAIEVIELTERLPRTAAAQVVAKQIIRSVSSIGSNIAEGYGRYSGGANANHLLIARGSAAETDSWLDLLRRMDVISTEVEDRLRGTCLELMAMLTALAKTVRGTR